jgi:hypothetical protein
MIRNFRELEAKMPPERLARADIKAKEILSEMLMTEIRRQTGLTQKELRSMLTDEDLGSETDAREEIGISTLRRIVEALGGQLELIAHLPKGAVHLLPKERHSSRSMVEAR